MGRIKSTLVKRTAKNILHTERALFTGGFEHNKKVIGNTMPSKKIRNKIAGYMGHLIAMEDRKAKEAAAAPKRIMSDTPEYDMQEA